MRKMATTGLWPVKSSLKNVLDYAKNPDKTIDRKYLNDDLADVIGYAADDNKTDRKMYVTGINCIAPLAYNAMTATKKAHGKEGGNVAYHGYQSFVAGEVTAEEAHKIGLETARRMWGDDYEVLVTTHLNTDNIHNHMVVNSVSFRTGKKFANKIADHRRLREISDEVCREYDKSVLENAPFNKSDKKEYWLHKAGKLTRRDILRRDIDYAISMTSNMKSFESVMKSMGYRWARGAEYRRPSIIGAEWKRAVRLDSLGEKYSYEKIMERLREDESKPYGFYQTAYGRHRTDVAGRIKKSMDKADCMDGVQIALELIIALCRLVTGTAVDDTKPRPLSPELRAACVFLDRYTAQLHLAAKHNLVTDEDVGRFIVERSEEVQALYSERKSIDNRIRRCDDPDEKQRLQKERREISERLKPLRKELNIAKDILVSLPHVRELLRKEDEREAELSSRGRERRRG